LDFWFENKPSGNPGLWHSSTVKMQPMGQFYQFVLAIAFISPFQQTMHIE
jgi:hypothetical protein